MLSRLRGGVVRTARWPGLGRIYRAIYRLQIDRASGLLARVDGVRAVLLRGSAGRRVSVGLSDIDFVVVLNPDLSCAEELRVVDAVDAVAVRVNRLAPLVGDIHIVTEEELRLLGRLAGALAVLVQDATCVAGSLEPSAVATDSPVLHSEALIREALFWTGRAIHQLMVEPSYVGQRLAGRSLAKADLFLDAVGRGELDLCAALGRCLELPEPPRADFAGALQRLWQGDRLLGEAPEVVSSADGEAPAWTRLAPRLRRWAAPLAEHPAVASVVLSAEGACEHDLRLFVALHPGSPGAEAALRSLRRSLGRADLLGGGYYSRAALPLVVTVRQLRRPGFLRSTFTEPWARARFGVTLVGDAPRACGHAHEAARGVALSLATAGVRARELWRKPVSESVAAQWIDLTHGLVPTARTLAESGGIRVTADADGLGDAASRARALRDPGRRLEAYRTIRDGFVVWSPRLLSMIDASSERDAP